MDSKVLASNMVPLFSKNTTSLAISSWTKPLAGDNSRWSEERTQGRIVSISVATGFFLYLGFGRVENEMLWRDLVCLSFSLKRIFEVNTRSKIGSSSNISKQLLRQTGKWFSVMVHLHGGMTVKRWCEAQDLIANNVEWHSSKLEW